ncbi:MAG: ATP synthase F1 subunit epsilon [Planctomycetota bacterium]|nr:ATP synthase F1 subunit epsilon [Planctomycetota bacterium]MDA1140975.1 ATP synthase F1 subunit epsilon [Planctomycetota bacterium]
MPAPYQLKIVTREKVAYTGEVTSTTAPATRGSIGIWANHAPLITSLEEGKLAYTEANGKQTVARIKGGFLEVRKNVVTILTDEMVD